MFIALAGAFCNLLHLAFSTLRIKDICLYFANFRFRLISLTVAQNEDVVKEFLEGNPCAGKVTVLGILQPAIYEYGDCIK